MANTTNFGWETPDDTDLVKDGAAAIRTLGSAIDTSLADLEGGTTGQVLAKNSNTDMDFIWVAQDDSNAIQNAIVDAKGDLIAASAADTPARLAVGTNGKLLMADSAEATGLKWATDPTSDVITTAGDLIYGTAADTVARLGIGTAGQVLQVNSGATAPEWATPAGGGGGPTVSAQSNTFQNISQSTNTKIDLQTENWDTAGAFASSRFTPLTSGYYQLNGWISFEANGTQRTMFAKNGTVINPQAGFADVNPGITVSTIVYLNGTTDYVELYGYSDYGSTPRRAYDATFSAIFIRS